MKLMFIITDYDSSKDMWLGFSAVVDNADYIIGEVPAYFKIKQPVPLEDLLGKTVSLSEDYDGIKVGNHLEITADHFVL